MGEKKPLWREMSFELSAVPATRSSIWRRPTSSDSATRISMSRIFCTASWPALRKLLMIICGCMFSSMNGLACLRNSAPSSTTLVVPSPTSASCESEMSTSVLAAGCTTSSSCMMVAPSFEMVV